LVKESDVHAEIGEVVSGKKKGREGDELILVDLTGTGAQVRGDAGE
jgi:ornithine cyclodeaminase/alanine dehydrogenase-like protein (mu-crystallin family)